MNGASGQLTRVTLGVADERGDGRPDYPYQGRMFYADNVEPSQVPAAGGTVTISGMGFRAGNAVLVNGVAAQVSSWSATTIVATMPALAVARAAAGVALDVEVMDRGTGATSTMTGALIYSSASTLPNAMILVSAPAGTLDTGTAASVPFAVRVVGADGVTPVVGEKVVFSAAAGSASFGPCNVASCTVTTDATGSAATVVTPLSAGTITLAARDGALLQTANLDGQTPPNSMRVLIAPSGSYPVGTSILQPFVVRVYGPDGVTGLPNHRITFTIAGGSAVYTECETSTCLATTDGTGAYSIFVTPTGPGLVTLQATDDSVSQQATFTATQSVDTMVVVSTPRSSGFVGESVGTFAVQLLNAAGVGDYGQPVIFTTSPGTILAGCTGSPCVIYGNSAGVEGGAASANAPGTYRMTATFGALTQSVSFTVAARSITLNLLSTPDGITAVGSPAAKPFTVQLLDLDGVTPLAGHLIVIGGPENDVLLKTCHDGTCQIATDGNGIVSTVVTPLVPGTIPLSAVYSPLVVASSITAVAATDSMRVVTQPGGATLYPGSTVNLQVQLLTPDGVTPDTGKTVTLTVTNGNFSFAGCGNGPCSVTTDGQGLASISGVAGVPGAATVTAAYGTLSQAMNFTVSARPNVMQVLSAPASGTYVGTAGSLPFAVRVYQSDGVTVASSQNVTVSVTNGSATLSACAGASSCTLQTDSNGMIASPVTPTAPGIVSLLAAQPGVSVSANFTAISRAEILSVLSVPANGALVGDVATIAFAVQVLQGDGVTAGAGRSVTLSVSGGSASLGACGAGTCTLVADATGRVSTLVMPLMAGTITLLAADASVTQNASFTAKDKPDVLQLVSAPANGAFTGVVAALPFAVQVNLGTGVSAGAGKNVTLTVTNGAAGFVACAGASICTLTTDAKGVVSSGVTPMSAGTIGLQAADGNVTLAASFTAVTRPDVVKLVSVPADGSFVGDVAGTAFVAQVFEGDGVTPAVGRPVVLSVSGGSASLPACGGASCSLITDSRGLVSSGVTPLAAGTITLSAADGSVTASASFMAANKPDLLTLVSAPASGAYVGVVAATAFSVQVMLADGSTPGAGKSVTLTVTNGSAGFTACGNASICVLVADASGLVTSGVQPLAAGGVTLLAADGNVSVTASFNAVNRPDVLTVKAVPADGSITGSVAAVPFSVQLTGGDGSVLRGKNVTVTVTNGSLSCGGVACTLVTDANGMVSTGVTPASAGTVGLTESEGAVSVSASFVANWKPDVLTVSSVPADGSVVGVVAVAPFAVQVNAGDGTAGAGRNVTMMATNAILSACGAARCVVVSDANGVAATGVQPASAGAVSLTATLGSSSVSASFNAKWKADGLALVSVPADGSLAGDVASPAFAVRVMAGDGTLGPGGM